MQKFMDSYMNPFYDKSIIPGQRKVIRDNLLYNQIIKTIEIIYTLSL